MPNKQLDKAAWDWAATIEPGAITKEHIETAYRLKLKRCKTACRRNCKTNPHCLSNLGEKVWMQDIADDDWHEIDDQNSERRIPDTFVGLKNLGATCYVNSFLQVWFHNPTFRKAIYAWRPEEDPQEGPVFSEDGHFKPVSFVGHLQILFAFLQFSSRKYIDPSSFINVLGLNTTMQQDAQEFRQLFISLLEKKLSHQRNNSVRHIIDTQYSGECSYITRCHNCSNESTRSSRFYDLDLNIKGHKELSECLDEFLQEERLDGSNQYLCSVCQSKQNATRFIRLKKLPPVLHLQLLRFVFERQARCKKKLNSFIRFPEVLDMSKYMNRPHIPPANTVLYELSGVLIHRGPSAYSGHYIAHIKDRMTGTWFKFNDETAEKMEGKKLQLGTEEGLGITSEENLLKSTFKSLKAPKGQHSSNNAYMLVYKLKNENVDAEEQIPDTSVFKWELPDYLQQAVVLDNSQFEDWVKELDEQRAQNVATSKAKQSEIRSLHEKLPVEEGEDFEWVPTSWISKWLSSDPGEVPKVDNSLYLCQHNKLNPDVAGKLKCITLQAAEEIFQKYGGGPRIRDGLCKNCVESRHQIIRIKNKVMEDHKAIAGLLKAKISEESDAAFWIGKASLRSWRRKVLRQYEESQPESNNQDGSQDEHTEEDPLPPQKIVLFNTEVIPNEFPLIEDQEDEPSVMFNEDLLCEHKNLIVDENQRRLISSEVWKLLKHYFPDAPEFARSITACNICQVQVAEDQQTKDLHKLIAQEQKSSLLDIYLDRNRPNISKLEPRTVLYAVSLLFIEEWRKYIRDPSRRDPITNICNAGLLCKHGKLEHLLHGQDPDDRVALLWDYEWSVISTSFIVDQEIVVTCTREENELPHFHSTPEVCESCYMSRLQEQQQQLLQYTNAKIFVRRVSKTEPVTSSRSLTAESDADEGEEPHQKLKKRRVDEEYQGNGTPPSDGCGDTSLPATPDVTWMASSGSGVRRSNRRRPQRGEKTINVSSDQTLRDLKIQIMKLFSVAPFDQHLSVDGRPLTDNLATLGSLEILPGALLLLKVDIIGEEVIDLEDYVKASAPETGFEGTELLG